MRRGVGIVCLFAAVGCGAEAGDGTARGDAAGDSVFAFDLGVEAGDGPATLPDGAPCPTLEIDPANMTIFIDTSTSPPTPAHQCFKVVLHRCDGTVSDV